MRYYYVEYGNGYCGCDDEEAIMIPDDEDIDAVAYGLAMSNAESYEHIVTNDLDDDYESEEEALEAYYDNVDYSYQEITEEEYLAYCEENEI